VLHQFNGDDLESQLQTFDSFLDILSPKVRPTLSNMMHEAAKKAEVPATQLRLEQAATSIADGGRVTAPYNHEEAMRKYREDHKRSYPDQTNTPHS
jgi:TRAP-type C4-dicarboxylate transport system substrate-binding protein